MTARAGIVVTGTEVLTGRVTDRNGPWIADRLAELGIDLAHVTICGDRPADMEAQLRFLAEQGVDLILTSGGLGPTADDLTLEIVARFAGVELALDSELEARIAEILRPLMKRWPDLDPDALLAGNRKQALVPDGATVLDPVGTAPGMAVPAGEGTPPVIVLPGPPSELRRMWPDAVAAPPFQAALARATAYEQATVRLFGIPESEIAETLRVAETAVEGIGELEVTTCLRRGELEVVTRYEPAAADAWAALERVLRERHADTIFSTDGSSIDEQLARLLEGRTIAVGESCTGGLLAGRLTELPGSSAHFAGGVVAYSNRAKTDLLGVDAALVETHGAVSAEVAEALAAGAIDRFGADVGVGVTGIAGPGGGTPDKPVGTVYVSARTVAGDTLTRHVAFPGSRGDVRERSTTLALHLVRRLLSEPAAAPR